MLEYQDFYGHETREQEFKIVILYFNEEIDNDSCLELLKSGRWIFNSCIKFTIKLYINKYLSKYISSFTHRMTGAKKAELLMGINDDGKVVGIPYKGVLNKSFIEKAINNVFRSLVKFPNLSIAKKIRDNLIIELIKVNYDEDKIIDFQYDEYVKKQERINKIKRKHKKLMSMWNANISKHTQKLNVMLNSGRDDFLNYLKERTGYRKSKLENKYSRLNYLVDVPTYYDLIVEIKTKDFKAIGGEKIACYQNVIKDKSMIFKDGYIGESYNPKLIVPYYEMNEIIALYHLGKMKDLYVYIAKSFKPSPIKIPVNIQSPLFSLSQIENMIPLWMSNNSLNLYVIKIIIPTNILDENQSIQYWNSKKKRFQYLYRTVESSKTITINC
jgi:hypothetical protein